ncbi:MAG: TonB-dependent receptor [Ekhidna sp.]|nr:TonB-dependent receptor [Ekhidna sp.]
MNLSLTRAQDICRVKGRTMDAIGESVPSATVVGYDSLYQLIGFCVSDEEGIFQIDLPCDRSYLFVVNHLNYKADTSRLLVDRQHREHSFVLEEDQLLLDEVKVTETLPISIKGDTITYSASSFTKGNEETLRDLLERLPGFEVNENGDIYHQGRKVNNIMIEGKPFFGNNTKMATENIPVDALSKIQLLDNFSDNPLNLGETRRKALNIILNENKKNIVFGNALIGGGFNKRYQAQEKAFYFSKRFDAAVIADANNINDPLFTTRDYIELFGGLESLLEEDEVQFSLRDLELSVFSPELVNEKPSETASINLNFQSKKKKFKANTFTIYSNSNPSFLSEEERRFISPLGEIIENEDFTLNQAFNTLLHQSTIKYVLGKNTFLKYSPYYKHTEVDDSSNRLLDVDAGVLIRSSANNRQAKSLDQQLIIDHKLNNKSTFKLQTRYTVNDKSTALNLDSDQEIFEEQLGQRVNQLFQSGDRDESGFLTQLSFSGYLGLKSILKSSVGYQRNNQKLVSRIFLPKANKHIFPNDVNYTVTDTYAGLSLQQKVSNVRFEMGGKMHAFLTEIPSEESKKRNYIFTPLFNIKQSFSSSHSLRFSYSVDVIYPIVDQLITHPIVKNYRTLEGGNFMLNHSLHHDFSINYFNFSVWSQMTFIFNVGYLRKLDAFRNEIATNSGSTQVLRSFNNQPEDRVFGLIRLDKKWSSFSVFLKGNIAFEDFQSIVDNITIENNSLITSSELSLSLAPLEKSEVSIGIKLDGNLFKQNEVSFATTNWGPLIGLNQSIGSWVFAMSAEHRVFEGGDNSNQIYTNITGEIQCKISDHFEAKGAIYNLLNNDSVVKNTFNTYYSSTKTFIVLERIFSITASYKF